MKKKSLRKNLTFLLPIVFLLSLSVLNLYGAKYISHLYSTNFMKQILWIVIGSVALFLIYKADTKTLEKLSFPFYIAGIISLILVLFFGSNINGATSWFKIGPFSFQPSELFKFFYIIFLSSFVSKYKNKNFILFIKILLLTFMPCILIFLEPDTGVVLMYLLMMFGLIIESKIPKKYLTFTIGMGVLFILGFFLIYFFKSDAFIEIFGTSFFYRIDRILNFHDASSYQISNALIGVGASGLTGFGILHEKIYVPEVTTDFAFDLIILNFGSFVGITVVLTYTFLLWKMFDEIKNTKKEKDRLMLSMIFYMMLFQIFEHVLMNLGLTPITGITLPFLSYGGSSLLSYFMLFGLVLKITTNNSSYN